VGYIALKGRFIKAQGNALGTDFNDIYVGWAKSFFCPP